MKIRIVDAFTSEQFNGNPAGVCIVKEFPSQELMQNIAKEINHSETAFVKPLAKNSYHIRWFTPNSEAPLCGHATLASSHILIQEGLHNENDEISFKSLAGELIVNKTGEWLNLNFPLYNVTPIEYSPLIAEIIKIKPAFVGFSENCIFTEFVDAREVKELAPDLALLTKYPCRALIATSRDDKYDFISRYFAPRVGINEDPVCASAHCRLIPYWSEKLNKTEMIAYQASARGGVIKCKNLGNRVLISGKAVTVIIGELNLLNIKELRDVA
ncbi:putative isomerase [Candidatus Jidaibacter acanthamoeba]|uniref:Putative isomerase n=1 Tax=Candidatus Jidaibacter acanthamoebae TaxID=86105 RepID=A0A0C1MZL2_9RICK|nr:PhzF family phenazine biosynthesis protein [Candidatus Jidaibacter acanthamoeba]KIE05511.1 putative isomerase [Candidatus Jidaibacter acanthamoeba]